LLGHLAKVRQSTAARPAQCKIGGRLAGNDYKDAMTTARSHT
jgi:hypothetical protein